MSIRKLNTLFWVALAVLASVSCKKDEENEVTPSLYGTLKFDVPEFVTPGHTATMTPYGITHPDGKEIGYHWKVTPGMSKPDTTKTFTYTFPDSLATYTVTCAGYAKDYTSSYATIYVTVVKPGIDGSLAGTGIKADDKHITVNGVKYYYTRHNGLDWMRSNLAVAPQGAPYTNAEAAGEIFGRFYSYREAADACPEGWRLPADKEWRELAESVNSNSKAEAHATIPSIAPDFMGDILFNGKKMWEYWPQIGEITDKAELAMLPAGYANLGERGADGTYPTAAFFGMYEYATFWTADMVDGQEGMAYYRYMICDQPDMYIGKGDTETFGASVRCVRESVE